MNTCGVTGSFSASRWSISSARSSARAADLVPDQLQDARVGGLADQQVPAVQAEPEGHHDQEHADRDRSTTVPDR
jgi:hypothetical protein